MKTILLGNLITRATLQGVLPAMRVFLICFLLSIAQAVTPPPSGGYPGRNTAAGTDALLRLTDGTDNTALGSSALVNNTEGQSNTGVGAGVFFDNRRGNQNTGTGLSALGAEHSDNTAFGYRALDETRGDRNTAIGWNALRTTLTGTDNIALGHEAGRNLFESDSFNIHIGHIGIRGDSRVIRIGDADQVRTFIAGVRGAAVTGAPVVVNAAGELGTAPSSQCFKDEIKPIGTKSEAIFALKPVTFRYKKELDPKGTRQFGLVAEEVEKVDRDLVVRDCDGKPYTVRYDAVNAMVLNEFLKKHRKVAALESAAALLMSRLKEQDSKIQKVSEQLEMRIPAPPVVNNQ